MTYSNHRNPMLERIKEDKEIVKVYKPNKVKENLKLLLLVPILWASVKLTYDNYIKPGDKVNEAETIKVKGGQINPSNIHGYFLEEMANANLRPTRDAYNTFKNRLIELNEGNINYQFINGYDQFNFKNLNNVVMWPDVDGNGNVGNSNYKTIENKIK